MAEWKQEGDDYLLIENHCPICAAATECQGFCRSELEIFSEALGREVSIERSEHIIAGARRCLYRIQPRGSAQRSLEGHRAESGDEAIFPSGAQDRRATRKSKANPKD
jgi:hypothetical protein